MNEPEYYKGKDDRFRWKVKAKNGRVIDASSQSFSSKQAAQNNYALGQNKSELETETTETPTDFNSNE